MYIILILTQMLSFWYLLVMVFGRFSIILISFCPLFMQHLNNFYTTWVVFSSVALHCIAGNGKSRGSWYCKKDKRSTKGSKKASCRGIGQRQQGWYFVHCSSFQGLRLMKEGTQHNTTQLFPIFSWYIFHKS